MLIWRNVGHRLRTEYRPLVLAKHVDQVPCLNFELLLIAVTLATAFLILYLPEQVGYKMSVLSPGVGSSYQQKVPGRRWLCLAVPVQAYVLSLMALGSNPCRCEGQP